MRIGSGKFRGKIIAAPKNLPVRPTTDMAKEALFSILGNTFFFESVRFLDLFSGTGNLSYEIASRGCEDITAVDSFRECTKFIQKTSVAMGFQGFTVFTSDAIKYLDRFGSSWDLIVADPPYDYKEYGKLIEKVLDGRLKENGIFALEHSAFNTFEDHPHCFDTRHYGSAHFSFFGDVPVQETQETNSGLASDD